MSIIDEIRSKSSALNKKIVLPEPQDERILKATEELIKSKICRVALIGEESVIRKDAAAAKACIDGAEIISVNDPRYVDSFAKKYYELRKSKGVTEAQAAEAMKNTIFFAAMMVAEGLADGYVAGSIATTGDTLRPAIQIIKTAPGIKTVSSYFLMVVPDKSFGVNGSLIFADCAVVPEPTAEQLAEIAVCSAINCRKLLGVEPRVAMLSFSTKGSATSPSLDKVIEATELVKKNYPDIIIDGEIQFDAAIVPGVGIKKAPGSPLEGKANVLIFPDLNAGNIAYKAVQRLANAEAIGPVVQGTARPINDLSRGCSVSDIVSTVAITALAT
ncbi:MAG: phosphate acetyltransferase [Candidatus Auribacter fodinae]|jgi:phosphate acetyltransferase|uniref:Phosphate acetyltransferase n=1 Tax=Candidatus Auribacter fodinae TaxID=2093366 RepID=A0A3A4QY11_9BACT|nr:MAG: phosphate acetyltransferase [Candidatus Auribacter fodinae]